MPDFMNPPLKGLQNSICARKGEIVVAHVSLRKTFLARPQFFDVLFSQEVAHMAQQMK